MGVNLQRVLKATHVQKQNKASAESHTVAKGQTNHVVFHVHAHSKIDEKTCFFLRRKRKKKGIVLNRFTRR